MWKLGHLQELFVLGLNMGDYSLEGFDLSKRQLK